MRVRLRDTIEVFTAAAGGDTWITHGARTAKLVIRNATARDRALLDALRDGPVDAGGLADRLAADGHELSDADAAQTIEQLMDLHLLEDPDAAAASGIDGEDLERYDRQLAYFADLIGQREAYAVQRRLARAHVVILGCGGLGSWTALALVCSGVRRLTLVDDDVVSLSNLNRQVLYGRADVGAQKVAAAREALLRLDPRADITARDEHVDAPDRLVELAADADLVVATADQPVGTIGRWVNDACLDTGTPWISAGQYPPEVRVGPLYVPGATACHACAELAAQRSHPHYAELARSRERRPVYAATTGPASGLIGSILANEIVAFLGGVHPPSTAGHVLAIDLQTMAVAREAIQREPSCPSCSSGTAR